MNKLQSLQYIINNHSCGGMPCYYCYYKGRTNGGTLICDSIATGRLSVQAEIDLKMELEKLHNLIVGE